MNSNTQEGLSDPVTQLFTERSVVLVHFIGEGPGIRGESTKRLTPIESALVVAAEKREVPCSTVGVGDSKDNWNYFGRIGLILDPISRGNVTHSTATDGATESPPLGETKRINTNGLNSNEAITNAICQRARNGHNEICVKDYRVVGLFWEVPHTNELSSPSLYLYSRDDGKAQYSHSILDFAHALPDIPVYIWRENRFVRTSWRNRSWQAAAPVALQDVYL